MRVCPTCGVRYEPPAQYCQRDGAPLRVEQETRDPYLGTRILGQFRLEKIIGSGGMGVVYAGWDEGLGRRVAVKILHRDLVTNRDVVHRFHREAQIAHQLDHPNIVRLILFGQLPDGNLYLVLEYLEGPTLAQALERDGPMPAPRAVKIMSAIADAIGYAHRRDIVHRDLKPENVILIHRDGDPDHPKVLDFGIAKMLIGNDTVVTQTGLIFGTARYISPEGAQGEPVDKRSDVYSLGVITYQLLAGQTPFDAPEPVQLLLKHIHDPPPPLRTHPAAQHVPPALEAVVMRALAKNPAARFGDASAFARALREALTQSDPALAIRSMVPTAAMPMYVPTAVEPSPSSSPEPGSTVDASGIRRHPASSESPRTAMPTPIHGTPEYPSIIGTSSPNPLIPPDNTETPASPRTGPTDSPISPSTTLENLAPPPSSTPFVGTQVSQGLTVQPRIAMSAVFVPAHEAMPSAADLTRSHGSTRTLEPPPETFLHEPSVHTVRENTAYTIAPADEDEIAIPGLPTRSRNNGRSRSRTVVTVMVSVLITVAVGAGVGWALGLYPSQRREAQIRALLARAQEAYRAERLVHDASNDDVEDLTDAVLVLSPGNERALQLRRAAAMRLRNAAIQHINDGHPDRALPLLQAALRLTSNDTELLELQARAERDLHPPAVPPPVHPSPPPPARTPSRSSETLRSRSTPATGNSTQRNTPEPSSTSSAPAVPVGSPTFVPGRDPSLQPPPPENRPAFPPPQVVIQQPPVVNPPSGDNSSDPSVSQHPTPSQPAPPPPPVEDPNGGGVAF